MPDAPVAPLSRPSASTRLVAGSAAAETERLLLDALALDERARASTPREPAVSRAALGAYQALLARAPDLDAIAFDDARPSWPTALAIELAIARLFADLADHASCLARYEAILAAHPRGDGVEEAAAGALLCANALTVAAPPTPVPSSRRRGRRGRRDPEPRLDERILTGAETAAAAAFRRFACRAPQHPDAVAARYRHARVLYEANHFDEAAALFRSIAFEHPSHELAVYAANLYLDSLNVLGTRREGRTSCLATLTSEVDPLARLFCASEAARRAHPDLCEVLQQLRCDALIADAERDTEAGRHADAAQTYEAIAREHQECGRLDEILCDAAISWDAAHDPSRAQRAREQLLQQFPESSLAERALWALAVSEHALARYDEAATYYEAHARMYPRSDGSDCGEREREAGRCPNAGRALSSAVFLRLGLGDLDRAIEDAAIFERNYARSRRDETASLSASVVIALARQERWADVARLGDGWARRWGATASSELALGVRGALARAYTRQRSPRAPALWTVLADADLRSIADELGLARARDVMAEARLRTTDADTEAFLARRAPRANLAAWRAARDEELRSLRARLERIAELEAPRWDVEAIARIARLEAHLAREAADAALLAQATERYAACLAHATATRTFDEASNACAEGLVELAPDRFTPAHELTTGARFVASGLALPRPVSASEGDAASR